MGGWETNFTYPRGQAAKKVLIRVQGQRFDMEWVHACTLKARNRDRSGEKGKGPALDTARVHACALKVWEKAAATLEGRQGSRMVDIPAK